MSYGPGVLWSIIMLYFSLLPGSDVPSILAQTDDIILHLGMYFICMVLFYLGLISWDPKNEPSKLALWVLLSISILAGGGIEVIQETFIPNRVGSIHDLISNTSGSLIGMTVCILWQRKQLKKLNT